MLEPLDIIGHLQDQEFDATELVSLLDQMKREQRADSANRAAAQIFEARRRFLNRRRRRLFCEFHDIVKVDIAEMRSQTRWERSQDTYRNNRKEKKRKNNGNKQGQDTAS